jgi:hypothetical protein
MLPVPPWSRGGFSLNYYSKSVGKIKEGIPRIYELDVLESEIVLKRCCGRRVRGRGPYRFINQSATHLKQPNF